MITETGENLDVLIIAETTHNWETFAAWYSIHKQLPDANVSIICVRNKETPFQLFQWTKRLNIKHFYENIQHEDEITNRLMLILKAMERGWVKNNFITIKSKVLITNNILPLLEKHSQFTANENAIIALNTTKENIEKIIFNHCANKNNLYEHYNSEICPEVKEKSEACSIVSYKKGVGRWLDTMQGCPFTNAAGLASDDMTINECSVISIWKKATSLYNATV